MIVAFIEAMFWIGAGSLLLGGLSAGIFVVSFRALARGVQQVRLTASKPKPEELPEGVVPWLWTAGGFRCPKCTESNRVKGYANHPKLCDCEEYYKQHLHFECRACGFKAIMQTADEGAGQ
jgi:hypothetical protein